MELDHKEINEILERYDIGALVDFEKMKEGISNQNWIITTRKGKFVLKCIAKDRRIEELLFEHAFIKHISNSNINYKFPFPLLTMNQETIFKLKGRYAWLYEFIEGTIPGNLNQKKTKQLAKLIAELHKISRSAPTIYQKDWGNPFQTGWLIEGMKVLKTRVRKKSEHDARLQYFYEHVDTCIEVLENNVLKGYETLQKFPIHCDWNLENIIFNDDILVGLIDFDNSRFDTAIRDITIFLQFLCADNLVPNQLDFKKVNDFLQEYNKYQILTKQELQYFPFIANYEFADYFWHLADVLQRDPKVKYTIHYMEFAFKGMYWHYKNAEKIVKSISI